MFSVFFWCRSYILTGGMFCISVVCGGILMVGCRILVLLYFFLFSLFVVSWILWVAELVAGESDIFFLLVVLITI